MLWLLRSAIVMTYPRAGGLPGAEDCALDEHLARFKRESSMIIWLATIAGAALFHLTPFMSVYVPLPAFLLPSSLQDEHAMRIQNSRIYLLRQAVFLVKLCAGLCWGADPAVRRQLGLRALPPDPGTWRTT